MPSLWSFALIPGLLLLVFLMIDGVPHLPGVHSSAHETKPRTLLPMVGAALSVAGIVGHLLQVHGSFSTSNLLLTVGVLALGGAVLSRWLVRTSFSTPSADPEDDPHYRWQGHPAQLTQGIAPGSRGRVAFAVGGQTFDLPAVSVDGQPIAVNTEVVIERLDEHLATVEPWAAVEARL